MLLDGKKFCLRRLLTLLLFAAWFPGCLNGNLQWSRSTDSTRNGAEAPVTDGDPTPTPTPTLVSDDESGTEEGEGDEDANEVEPFIVSPAVNIYSITPETGHWRGGYIATINGNGFASGAIVRIGNKLCSNVAVQSEVTLTCTVPELLPNIPYAIRIVNPDQTGFLSGTLFTAKVILFVGGPENVLTYDQRANGSLANGRTLLSLPAGSQLTDMEMLGKKPLILSIVKNVMADSYEGTAHKLAPGATTIQTPATFYTGNKPLSICSDSSHFHIVGQPTVSVGSLTTYVVNSDLTIGASAGVTTGAGSYSCSVVPDKFIYVMNGQSHTVSQFKYVLDQPVPIFANNEIDVHASGPMAVSPDGKFLIVATAFKIYTFSIDQTTGQLSEIQSYLTGQPHSYTDIKFADASNYFYLTDNNFSPESYKVYTFRVESNGLLSLLGDFSTSFLGVSKIVVDPWLKNLVLSFPGMGHLMAITAEDAVPSQTTEFNSVSAGSEHLILY